MTADEPSQERGLQHKDDPNVPQAEVRTARAGPESPLSAEETHRTTATLIADYIKQTSALATGTVVLSMTFVKDFLGGGVATPHQKWALFATWVLLGLAAVVGFFAQSALIGNIWVSSRTAPYKTGLRRAWLAQMALFFGGILAFAIFAWQHVSGGPPAASAAATLGKGSAISLTIPASASVTLAPADAATALRIDVGAAGSIVVHAK